MDAHSIPRPGGVLYMRTVVANLVAWHFTVR